MIENNPTNVSSMFEMLLEEVKKPAAERWVATVSADGRYGLWW